MANPMPAMMSSVAAIEIPAIIGNESSGGVAVTLSISAKVGEMEKGDEGFGEAELGDGGGEDDGDEGEGDEGEGDEGER